MKLPEIFASPANVSLINATGSLWSQAARFFIARLLSATKRSINDDNYFSDKMNAFTSATS